MFRVGQAHVWPRLGAGLARVWAGLVGVSEGLKCVSCGPGACLVRAWRGFGADLLGVSEGRPENKTKLGFLPL